MVLIVEDDKKLGASLERILRYAGHEAVTVPSAVECLALLQVRKPELIVTDLGLGAVDGLTLIKSIRSDAAYGDVPIVVYTSDFSKAMEGDCRAAGAADYVVKGTIGWGALVQRLEKHLKK